MKILLQENEKCRIVQKWSIVLRNYIICRQRKKWYGWITTIYLYAGQCQNIKRYAEYFDRRENYIEPMGKKQF